LRGGTAHKLNQADQLVAESFSVEWSLADRIGSVPNHHDVGLAGAEELTETALFPGEGMALRSCTQTKEIVRHPRIRAVDGEASDAQLRPCRECDAVE
jgi:hypothetical protein